MNARNKQTDLAGQRFGRLTVIDQAPRISSSTDHHRRWRCLCDCGNQTTVRSNNLRDHQTQSCGCLRKDVGAANGRANAKHGFNRTGGPTREYTLWIAMRSRCSTKTHKAYPNYGGRGIAVCERWGSFPNFLEDMGFAPSLEHSLDRIDVNGHYEPGNVRWATPLEQAQNTRTAITFNGKTQSGAAWERELGLNPNTVASRLQIGWPIEKILTTPSMKRGANTNKTNLVSITVNGVTHTRAEWSALTGINAGAIRGRLKRGWSPERAVHTSRHPSGRHSKS